MLKNNQITIAGCGHIGKLLAQQLLKKKIPVSAYVSSETSLAECKNRNIACEIIDLDIALDKALQNINLAGHRLIYLVPPPRSGKTDTRITTYLQAIEKHKPEKFVLISTTGVYGNCKGAWVDESTETHPTSQRGTRRSVAEEQWQSIRGLPLHIFRLSGIYGPGRSALDSVRAGMAYRLQSNSAVNEVLVGNHCFGLVLMDRKRCGACPMSHIALRTAPARRAVLPP